MNNITVAGILGKDAEIRYTNNGEAVASFSVADSQGKDKPTIWWRCSLFGKRAESLSPYLLKGQSVTVSGTVTEREYEKDGVKHKSMDVRVNELALQGGKREQSEQPAPNGKNLANAHPPAPRPAPKAAPRPSSGFDDMADDIPF